MRDWYLEDPSRLNGQPKFTIGNYAERNGILVPRRFTFQEAKDSGLDTLARSERNDEYNGVSGLLSSPHLAMFPDVASEEELRDKILGERDSWKNYCYLKQIPEETFIQQTSFSFWEFIEGYRQKVIADSAVPNRYHISTRLPVVKGFQNYTIVENGEIVLTGNEPLPEELKRNLPKLIESYEVVRKLGHFDPNHCPMTEWITPLDASVNYFLQSHRTRDFVPSTFRLTREARDGETEMLLVRGSTPEGGMVIRCTAVYGREASQRMREGILPDEEGCFHAHYNWLFEEIMFQRRRLQVNRMKYMSGLFNEIAKGIHLSHSAMFKPEISVFVDEHKIIPEVLFKPMRRKALREDIDQMIDLHIESDGRRALLRRAA